MIFPRRIFGRKLAMFFNSNRQRPFSACLPASCLVGSLLFVTACERGKIPAPPSAQALAAQKNRVIAQGQILPASGFIQLVSTPGDIVEAVHVRVGDSVTRGQKLVTLRSESVREKQMQALLARRSGAAREQALAVSKAQQQRDAALMKKERVEAQRASLDRKQQLLGLAQGQVEASNRMLSKLQSLAKDSVTREFVGQLEIDRQRIAVDESQLQYQQQVEAQRQAAEDLEWAARAADAELQVALEVLAAAEDPLALAIIDAEIETLEAQNVASQIVAPNDSVVIAVNVSAGEAAMQMPIIELADLETLVCEVEINEMDAARVQVGDSAAVSSRAFGENPLTGRVSEKFALVGRPQLKPLNPLARVDYRSITANVELDEASVVRARDWLQLQVEVVINVQAAVTQPAAPVGN